MPNPGRRLPSIRAALIPAYQVGLPEEVCAAAVADVACGCDASLIIRSCFTWIPFERLAEPVGAEVEKDVLRGMALTRYLADVGLDVTGIQVPRRRASTRPNAFGRTKIQFCLAVSREKIPSPQRPRSGARSTAA